MAMTHDRMYRLPTRGDINRCKELWPNDWRSRTAFWAGEVDMLVTENEGMRATIQALRDFAYRVSQIDLDDESVGSLWRMQEQARALLASAGERSGGDGG